MEPTAPTTASGVISTIKILEMLAKGSPDKEKALEETLWAVASPLLALQKAFMQGNPGDDEIARKAVQDLNNGVPATEALAAIPKTTA